MRWSLPAAAMRVVALLLLPLAEAYVPSGPLPVRSRAAAVTRQAAQMSGAMDGWPSRRNPNNGPPIDEERRSRSPGLQNNFYEISTADFKRPHGTGRAPPPPSDGSPDAASAGAPPAPSPPPAAPIDPKTGRALYSVGEETPMPGREREYEAYNGVTDAAAEPPTAQMPPPAATGAAPPLDSTLSALYQKLEQARLDLMGAMGEETSAPVAPTSAAAAPASAQAPPPTAQVPPTAAAAPPRRSGESHPVVDGTLSVLYQKLEQARVDLSRTTTLETTGPLVALVKDISAAIGNLEKL